jgi:hypothetical protein
MPNVTNFHKKRNDIVWQNSVNDYLHSFDCKIQFQKPNGAIENTYCTLNPQQLPVAEGAKNAPPAVDSTRLAVFDIDNAKWKSIPYDKIIDFKVETPAIKSMN